MAGAGPVSPWLAYVLFLLHLAAFSETEYRVPCESPAQHQRRGKAGLERSILPGMSGSPLRAPTCAHLFSAVRPPYILSYLCNRAGVVDGLE